MEKCMTYVIAIADEGLLDLTRYKTPDAHSFFTPKNLGIKTWDIYDQVIGAWVLQLQRIVTIGGDAEAGSFKNKGGQTGLNLLFNLWDHSK